MNGTSDLVWAGNPKDSFCGSHGRGQEGRGDRDRFMVEWKTGKAWFGPEMEEMDEGEPDTKVDESDEEEPDTEVDGSDKEEPGTKINDMDSSSAWSKSDLSSVLIVGLTTIVAKAFALI